MSLVVSGLQCCWGSRILYHESIDVTLSLTRIVINHRAIHDVKATDLGLGKVRFKAEVDFDGRVVTRSYLEKQDFDRMMQVSFCSLCLLL